MTDHDVKMGRGSPKTVGKFLCHLAEDPKQIAFMRVYQQIPITGTEDGDHDTLARQAVLPGVCGELESFKLLQSGGCSAVPRFLGHAESSQREHDLVPGGYVRYLVWEKVPGEPLTEEFFWAWMAPRAKISVLSSVPPMSKSIQILRGQTDRMLM